MQWIHYTNNSVQKIQENTYVSVSLMLFTGKKNKYQNHVCVLINQYLSCSFFCYFCSYNANSQTSSD